MTYTVSQAAEQLGVTADALRYYDEMGYIEADRTKGGHRRYSPEQIREIRENQPDTDPEKLRHAVLEIQARTHWVQQQVADNAGLSQHTVFTLIHGDRRFTPRTARKVYRLLERVRNKPHRAA